MIIHKNNKKFIITDNNMTSTKVVDIVTFNRCFYHCSGCFARNKYNVFIHFPKSSLDKELKKRLAKFFRS